jgi:2-polyprenyl-3-methyl-5-hydroxy-6-metoxy-1,4-benzoquinol methylase
MDRVIYDRMAEHDSVHWWYRGRRTILAEYLKRAANLPQGARLLEVGCGTGHNLPMLARFGTVDAIEIDAASREIASRRLGRPVLDAPLPVLSGIERGAYDLVAVLDVIEHVEDDVAALRAISECLGPSGKILITVPAHQWMWSMHDVVNHHYRRYSRAGLAKALAAAGLKSERLHYFNSLLFPLAVANRAFAKLTGKQDSDDAPPPGPVNSLFERAFSLERHAIGRVQLPIGLSLLTLASPTSRA